jgi:hypothetical protein
MEILKKMLAIFYGFLILIGCFLLLFGIDGGIIVISVLAYLLILVGREMVFFLSYIPYYFMMLIHWISATIGWILQPFQNIEIWINTLVKVVNDWTGSTLKQIDIVPDYAIISVPDPPKRIPSPIPPFENMQQLTDDMGIALHSISDDLFNNPTQDVGDWIDKHVNLDSGDSTPKYEEGVVRTPESNQPSSPPKRTNPIATAARIIGAGLATIGTISKSYL